MSHLQKTAWHTTGLYKKYTVYSILYTYATVLVHSIPYTTVYSILHTAVYSGYILYHILQYIAYSVPHTTVYSIFYTTYYSTQWASLRAQLVKNLPAMQDTWFNSWVGKIHWRRDRLPTPVFLGFPCDSAGKESACNVGDLGSILLTSCVNRNRN